MSNRRQIIISKDDHERLESLLFSGFANALSDKQYLQSLREELRLAKVVEAEAIPPNVVTMNTTVQLREVGTKEIDTYTLVYPHEANISDGKLSILAPIGTAILGYRVGDQVEWQVPSGKIRFKIEAIVYQPARDGLRTPMEASV